MKAVVLLSRQSIGSLEPAKGIRKFLGAKLRNATVRDFGVEVFKHRDLAHLIAASRDVIRGERQRADS